MKCLIIIFVLQIISQSKANQKYEFGLFENFVKTKDVFEDEKQFSERIKEFREEIYQQRETLRAMTNNEIIAKSFPAYEAKLESLRTEVLNFTSKFGTYTGDYAGAVLGLLVLRETYDLNITQFKLGKIRASGLTDFDFQSQHKLTVQDLMNLAVKAQLRKWFDSAAIFIREAFEEFERQKDTIVPEYHTYMKSMRNIVMQSHNHMITSRKEPIGLDYRTLPFVLDSKLRKEKKQPKFVKKLRNIKRDASDPRQFGESELKDDADRRICRGELQGKYVNAQMPKQCHFLHHDDPYLKLGPFKMEILLKEPFRMIYHDFLTEKEMDWMLEYSKPRLSNSRSPVESNAGLKKHATDSSKVKVIVKTVQVWMDGLVFNEHASIDFENRRILPMKDPYSHTIVNPVMLMLARKIEIATKMHVVPRFASTRFQVTNYGLSGLCESHVDPHGYIEGKELPRERDGLIASGDMIATFMAWLDDVEAGGATAFDAVDFEQRMNPTKGSAAFWMDLDRKGHKLGESSHMGCPILKGSKWILNKWIYFFDQFHEYPCSLDREAVFPPFSKHY